MLNFPRSTEFNKRISKQKFYDKLSIKPELKRVFTNQISAIHWRNKIAATTLNVAQGERVTELEVFELRLSQQSLDSSVLHLIDRELPYHILFIMTYGDECQAWIGYKEPSISKPDEFKVSSYYHTEWMAPENLGLRLEGLSIDAIYDNLVRQIAGDRLDSGATTTLKDAVERDNMRQQLDKKITAVEAKVRKEKQFSRQVILNSELKELKKELRGYDETDEHV
jgi:hypothetical protein